MLQKCSIGAQGTLSRPYVIKQQVQTGLNQGFQCTNLELIVK